MLAASVFHFGEIKVPELKQYLKENGAEIRMPQAAPQELDSTLAESTDISMISFGKEGLMPCICQDADTGRSTMPRIYERAVPQAHYREKMRRILFAKPQRALGKRRYLRKHAEGQGALL